MPERGRRPSGRDLAVAGAWWLALTAVGELAVALWAKGGLPLVASREGRVSDDAWIFLLRVVVPVFFFIAVVIVYSLLRFRAPADRLEPGSAQSRGNRLFSLGWLGTTSALTVLVIVDPGITGLNSIWKTRDAADPLVVRVTAQQWEWHFAYPQQKLADERTLVLPVGRPVRFVLSSRDVVHSFWVPAFRIKEDVVPGETRELYLTPDRQISTAADPLARVQCAELCGIGHAQMRAPVRVLAPAAFAAWVKKQGGKSMAMSGMGG